MLVAGSALLKCQRVNGVQDGYEVGYAIFSFKVKVMFSAVWENLPGNSLAIVLAKPIQQTPSSPHRVPTVNLGRLA